MESVKTGTLINCIDGRIQYPVMDYLKITYVGLYVNDNWEVEEIKRIG